MLDRCVLVTLLLAGHLALYALAIVELTDCNIEEVKIKMEVRLEFRRVQSEGDSGVISYGHKFVPKWF